MCPITNPLRFIEHLQKKRLVRSSLSDEQHCELHDLLVDFQLPSSELETVSYPEGMKILRESIIARHGRSVEGGKIRFYAAAELGVSASTIQVWKGRTSARRNAPKLNIHPTPRQDHVMNYFKMRDRKGKGLISVTEICRNLDLSNEDAIGHLLLRLVRKGRLEKIRAKRQVNNQYRWYNLYSLKKRSE